MKKLLFRISLSALGVVVIGGAIYALSKSSLFKLKNISYTYNTEKFAQFEDQINYTDYLKPQLQKFTAKEMGKVIWKVDIFELEKNIESLSWIQNVVVTRQYPNQLFVEIEPKKIIANIMKSPSKVQPVAEDSSLLTNVEIVNAPLVPILSGVAFSRDENLRERALNLLKEIPQEGAFSLSQISEVFPYKNDEFKLLLKNPKSIVLMNSENVPIKAQRISRVIEYMDPEEMKGRVIDSNFSKKVLVRPRNHR